MDECHFNECSKLYIEFYIEATKIQRVYGKWKIRKSVQSTSLSAKWFQLNISNSSKKSKTTKNDAKILDTRVHLDRIKVHQNVIILAELIQNHLKMCSAQIIRIDLIPTFKLKPIVARFQRVFVYGRSISEKLISAKIPLFRLANNVVDVLKFYFLLHVSVYALTHRVRPITYLR